MTWLLVFSFSFRQCQSSNLFQLFSNSLGFLNDRLSSCPPGTKPSENMAFEDESFSLVMDYFEDQIVCEEEYVTLYNEILELKHEIIKDRISYTKRVELIKRIGEWREDLGNKYAMLKKENFDALKEIFKERVRGTNIPNSIIMEYLTFIIENIINSNRATLKYSKIMILTVNLLIILIKTASSSEFLKFIINNIYLDMTSENQKKSLYSAYHQMLPEYSKYLEKFNVHKTRQEKFLEICDIYLVLLNYFPRNDFIFSQKIPSIFMAFFHSLPIYKALISTERDCFDSSLMEIKLYPSINLYAYLQIFDFFLKQSDFNNNFSSSIERVLHKLRIFTIVKEIFFKNEPLLYVLKYCLDYELYYIFEFLLNYSDNDTEFFETCVRLLEKLLINHDIEISILSQIISVCPRITVHVLDRILIELMSENCDRKDLHVPTITALRRIILATENISSHTLNWDMSEELQSFITQDTKFNPKYPYFFNAARIYLQRRFNIPFSRTRFEKDFSEEVDWIEVIGFVNFFLDRESSLSNKISVEKQPVVTTTHK